MGRLTARRSASTPKCRRLVSDREPSNRSPLNAKAVWRQAEIFHRGPAQRVAATSGRWVPLVNLEFENHAVWPFGGDEMDSTVIIRSLRAELARARWVWVPPNSLAPTKSAGSGLLPYATVWITPLRLSSKLSD